MVEKTYFVGELAAYFNVSRDTIRLYDKMGILHPSKVLENGYRVYNREDFICMDFIMRLKRLNIPLDGIKSLVNNSTIEQAEATMQIQEKLITDKIRELETLRIMAKDYQQSFSNAIKMFKKIDVRYSPKLLLKKIDNSIFDTMNDFSNLAESYVPKFTFIMSKEKFQNGDYSNLKDSSKRQSLMEFALTLEDDFDFEQSCNFHDGSFKIIESRKCVHSILKLYTNKDYRDLERCIAFMRNKGLRLIDNPILRLIFLSSYDIAYYELWAPIE